MKTAVTTCEACWKEPVAGLRVTAAGTDLLCRPCAIGGYPRRVDLFPPFGIYRLTELRAGTSLHRPSPPPPAGHGPPTA
ncbi:hypothetical protein ACFY8V_03010 [Streptomyces californicus]|uniref:hypothetical protein n=1 Tax=Streptomyces californicus TaxID=67351 RepID=UPI003693F924